MNIIRVDRSRIESYQRCPRRRYLEYHQDGTGVAPAKKNIALAVGGSVHRGLEMMLKLSMGIPIEELSFVLVELKAVEAALDDFAIHSGALELDTNEIAAMTTTESIPKFDAELVAQAQELGMSTEGLEFNREATRKQFDSMLYQEQEALVEALVRAYCRYRLRPLLEQFEVMEVEHGGEWLLYDSKQDFLEATKPDGTVYRFEPANEFELWFMSRLDALLRERQTNELYLQSYKTTGTWGDIRRLKAAEKDVQGLTEGIEVENRLQSWWVAIHLPQSPESMAEITHQYGQPSDAMYNFLKSLGNPPRIYAVRYEYLLKGERWEDKELSARLGMTVRTQRSPLIRQYVAHSTPQKGNSSFSIGDVCWSWDYVRTEDDKDSKLAWQNWTSQAVWTQDGGVKAWIDKLAESEILMSGEDSTVGMEPRQVGWKSAAQKLGVTRNHPFEDVFPTPVIVFRNDDELRDLVEQFEAQEVRVAGAVSVVATAKDAGELRSLLNQNFPQSRGSCFYPTQCPFTVICYGGDEVRNAPLENGFKRREFNHPQERGVEANPLASAGSGASG